MIRRGAVMQPSSPGHLRSLWYLICTVLLIRSIKKEKISRSISFIVLFTVFCNMALNLTALYIGLFVRRLEFTIFSFLHGILRRLVSITFFNLFFSSMLASCYGEDMCLVLEVVTSTLLLFPPALILYSLEVLEPRTVFMFLALFSMRLIIQSLEGCGRNRDIYRGRAFKVCVALLQYAVFCSIRSSLLTCF